jgi:hypothetical protein
MRAESDESGAFRGLPFPGRVKRNFPFHVAGLCLILATVIQAADLPPHVIDAGGGWISCERGYVLQNHRCLSDAEVVHGPTIEISTLPSAGDGAPGACPSGGCGSFVAPSYWAYSGPSYGGWSYPYFGGWSHSRQFRGGQILGRLGQSRSFAPGRFQAAPRHFHAVPERRAHAGFAGGKFFGGSPRGKGRAWR